MHIDARRKILRYPEYLARMQRGEQLYPLHVEMDISNTCNLQCGWCDFAHTQNGAMMPVRLADKILKDLQPHGIQAITFSGGGEPTTHPHFDTIVHHASKWHGFDCGVYTNGVLINPIIDSIRCLRWVYISLDAGDRASYEQIKGQDYFAVVIENVKRVMAQVEKTTIGLGFLICEENWPQFSMMIRLAESLSVDYVQLRPAVMNAEYFWVHDAVAEIDRWIDEEYHAVPVYVNRDRFFDLYNYHHNFYSRGYSVCRASMVVPCIGADGSLWVCPNTRMIRKLGDLNKESFREIWERRPVQFVGEDCRIACRNHELNRTLEFVCGKPLWDEHGAFV